MPRGSPRRLTALVAALVFLDLLLWFAVAPLLPGWEQSLHLSKAQAGMVVGAYSAAVLLASVPAGNLADRFGPRRVTIAATLLFAVAAPLHAFVGSFAELVSLRFAAGIFSAVSWSAALAWAIGSAPPEQRGRTAALINTALPISGIAGPLFGGPLVQLVGQKAAMGGLGVLVLLLAAVAAREPEVHAPAQEHVPLRESLRTVALDSWLLSANVALIVLAIAGTTMQTLGSLHLSHVGVSQGGIGAAFTAVAVAGTVTTLTLARMADRLDRLKLVGLGTLLLAPTLGAMALPLGTSAFIAAMVACGIAQAIGFTASYPLAADGAERAGVGQGIAMGLLAVSWGVGALIGPVVTGTVAQFANDATAFALAGALALAAALGVRWRTRG
ncbi:MAG TPA: MFS transporter [Gaiellales bacterium]|nr:MFS transporter [Gaiellales bacterium]